jgi:hypothetical protein
LIGLDVDDIDAKAVASPTPIHLAGADGREPSHVELSDIDATLLPLTDATREARLENVNGEADFGREPEWGAAR